LLADLKTRPGMQELKASEVAAVCAGLAEQVSAGGIIHNSDPMLATQVSGAADCTAVMGGGLRDVASIMSTACTPPRVLCILRGRCPRERDRWSASPAAARDDSTTTFVDVSTPQPPLLLTTDQYGDTRPKLLALSLVIRLRRTTSQSRRRLLLIILFHGGHRSAFLGGGRSAISGGKIH
jgi:hypothetical protein